MANLCVLNTALVPSSALPHASPVVTTPTVATPAVMPFKRRRVTARLSCRSGSTARVRFRFLDRYRFESLGDRRLARDAILASRRLRRRKSCPHPDSRCVRSRSSHRPRWAGGPRRACSASVLPSATLASLGAGDVNGVLGQDFLATFDYTLDYQHAVELSWVAEDEIERAPAARLPMTPDAGRFLVSPAAGSGTGCRPARARHRIGGPRDLRSCSEKSPRDAELLPARGQARMSGVVRRSDRGPRGGAGAARWRISCFTTSRP